MSSFLVYLFCFLLLQLPLFTSAQSSNNITLGSSLSSRDKSPYWTSPSGDFAFGFHPQRDVFLLAIWFEKIPLKTIVWTANNGRPVQRGATVQLTSTGVLSLRAPNGTELWKAEGTDNSRIAYAAMLDTGNFVMISTESAAVWESFSHPTDTMLPTQTLEANQKLTSRLNAEDYTDGRFELILQTDGKLVLYTIARPLDNINDPYWESTTLNNGSQFVFNQSGYAHLNLKSGSIYYLSDALPESPRDYYERVALDFDGVVRKFTYPRISPRNGGWPEFWSTSWSLPPNICSVFFGSYGSGVCGFNSYCRLDENQRPECFCPPGYTYRDPNNTFGGCIQNFLPQSCATDDLSIKEGFEMSPLPSTDWPIDDYECFKNVTESWCTEACLSDCFCTVAIISITDCWLKKFPLSRGYMNPGGTDRKALIKVRSSNSSIQNVPTAVRKTEDKDLIVPGSIILGISIVGNLMLLSLFFYGSCHKKQPSEIQKETLRSGSSGFNLQSYTYKELEDATDGFKEELGKGTFATVYKGVLESDYGGLDVAVKRLESVADGRGKEFEAEVQAIGKTNHKNLVQLFGFCDEEDHRLVVYEFMKNGSLESFLFGSFRLAWMQRVQIALGVARGLAYLHEDCSSQIIHCDIKPQNILIDDSFVARISDFGLAKLLKSDQTRTTTGIRGTRGYVAPEWFMSMAITAKVDVYSFGVLLLEIICCRKNVELQMGEEVVETLSDFAYECCAHKALHLLVMDDEAAKNDGKNLERLVMVSLWCIQEEPSLRPSMKKVTQMLEGAVEVSMPPDPSSFMSSIG